MTTQINKLTEAMNRKENVIAKMTQYILKVGENGAGVTFMNEYEEEQRIWNEMRMKRDDLKYQQFKAA